MKKHTKIVTVFGGTGFVGRHVVHRLARAGYRIKIPTRSPHEALFLRTMGTVGQIDCFACNIFQENDIKKALEDSSICINLIGTLNQKVMRYLHVSFPERLSQLLCSNGIERCIHISALLNAKTNNPISGQYIKNSLYARTKQAGEDAFLKHCPSVVVIKPSTIFGPEDKFLNKIASTLRLFPFFPLIGGGNNLLQPIDVNDVAECILRSVNNACQKITGGKVYKITGPDVLSFKKIVKLCMKVIGVNRELITINARIAKISSILISYFKKAKDLPTIIDMLSIDSTYYQMPSPNTDAGVNANSKTDMPTVKRGMEDIFNITPCSLYTKAHKQLINYQEGGFLARSYI